MKNIEGKDKFEVSFAMPVWAYRYSQPSAVFGVPINYVRDIKAFVYFYGSKAKCLSLLFLPGELFLVSSSAQETLFITSIPSQLKTPPRHTLILACVLKCMLISFLLLLLLLLLLLFFSSNHRYMGRLAALAEAEEARDLFSARLGGQGGPGGLNQGGLEDESGGDGEPAPEGQGGQQRRERAAASAEAVVAGLATPSPLPPGSPPFPLFWRRMLEVIPTVALPEMSAQSSEALPPMF